MQQQKFSIRLLGGIIAIFASLHLFLNLYIIILPLVLKSDEIQRLMQALSQTFGPIAIQQDRNTFILCVKLTVSALFLTSGIGVIKLKEWSRKLLLTLLGLRILYGFIVCIIHERFHPHLIIIIAVGLFLFYYLARHKAREEFK